MKSANTIRIRSRTIPLGSSRISAFTYIFAHNSILLYKLYVFSFFSCCLDRFNFPTRVFMQLLQVTVFFFGFCVARGKDKAHSCNETQSCTPREIHHVNVHSQMDGSVWKKKGEEIRLMMILYRPNEKTTFQSLWVMTSPKRTASEWENKQQSCCHICVPKIEVHKQKLGR